MLHVGESLPPKMTEKTTSGLINANRIV